MSGMSGCVCLCYTYMQAHVYVCCDRASVKSSPHLFAAASADYFLVHVRCNNVADLNITFLSRDRNKYNCCYAKLEADKWKTHRKCSSTRPSNRSLSTALRVAHLVCNLNDALRTKWHSHTTSVASSANIQYAPNKWLLDMLVNWSLFYLVLHFRTIPHHDTQNQMIIASNESWHFVNHVKNVLASLIISQLINWKLQHYLSFSPTKTAY